MNEPITCFLPCRKGSERIPGKNIKPFANFDYGLIEIKLRQLLATPEIEKIVLSTNDEVILNYAHSLKVDKVITHYRDEVLSLNTTSTDELIAHAYDQIDSGHILWTHVTSPFVTSEIYSKVIQSYGIALKQGFDSLMTTTPIHGFLWNSHQPINYDRNIEKWPRTQTIEPIYEVNSAIFLAHRNIYVKLDDRIGQKPYFYTMDKLVAYDIDWPEDFLIAELLAKEQLVKT